MTKTLYQIIFFFFHQNQNICSATLRIRIFFQKKNHSAPTPTAPLDAKWSVPYQFLNLIENYQNHSTGTCGQDPMMPIFLIFFLFFLRCIMSETRHGQKLLFDCINCIYVVQCYIVSCKMAKVKKKENKKRKQKKREQHRVLSTSTCESLIKSYFDVKFI